MTVYHLAIDIGASSGRHVIGSVENGQMHLHEIYRFENKIIQKNGSLCWDIDRLFSEVIAGMKKCREAGMIPATIGIDTWAVDFVLLDHEHRRLTDAVSYRDSRTDGICQELEDSGILSFKEQYQHTGIQYQKFNTVYQLSALKKADPQLLSKAEKFLMIPDYLNYLLTGCMINEYTNATTTGLIRTDTKNWDKEMIARLGFPEKIFLPIGIPGTCIGTLNKEAEKACGFNCRVILPASHDTGSAFLSAPLENKNSVILSSGTWSLLGIENAFPIVSPLARELGFTNEGGYDGRYRFLKNIMGLWIAQTVRRELADSNGKMRSFSQLADAASSASEFSSLIHPDDPRFLSPRSMIYEIKAACLESGQKVPSSEGEIMQTIYRSLAADYCETIKGLEKATKRKYTDINIVGGGCQDSYLNQMTANLTGMMVHAGPVEGTAIGNLLVQMIEDRELKNMTEARDLVKTSFEIKEIKPL